jgi:hypothetical protein
MAFAGHCGLAINFDGLAGDIASVLYNDLRFFEFSVFAGQTGSGSIRQ